MPNDAPRGRDAAQRETPDSGGPLVPADEVMCVEQTVEIKTTPERVFEVLTDPNNITRYAGGIEGAEVLEKPEEGYVGARLQLVTRGGNIRRAKVIRADHECIEVLDERGLRARWEIQPLDGGLVRIRNTIEGPLTPKSLNALRYDADVKFQALQHILEDADPISGAG